MPAEQDLDAGIEAFRTGDFDAAVSRLEWATRQDGEDFRAFSYLGAAYAQQGRYDAAIGAFRRAADIRPDIPKVHYNLGQAYEAARVPREAWFEYKTALDIDRFYQPAKTALALLGARMRAVHEQYIEVKG